MATYRYLRADKKAGDGTPPAYVKVSGKRSVHEIAYPNGERARGRAAGILLANDLKPVCTFTEVEREETPFEGDSD